MGGRVRLDVLAAIPPNSNSAEPRAAAGLANAMSNERTLRNWRLMLSVLSAVVLLAVPQPAASYKVIGAGNASCGTWTSERAKAARSGDHFFEVSEENWVLGFLSGVGYAGAGMDPLQGLDANAVVAWLDQYCQAHPRSSLEKAAVMFVMEHPQEGRFAN